MEDDNLTKQVDEIEALSSIYGNEWCTVDASNRIYSINIAMEDVGSEGAVVTPLVTLQVQLPVDYPSKAPPIYNLNAPWLRGDQRMKLSNSLEDIYVENSGENILYLWIEKVREFLQDTQKNHVSEDSPDTAPNCDSITNDLSVVQLDTESYTENFNYHKSRTKDNTTNDKDTCPEIVHGEIITDRKSVFQGHLARVESREQVVMVEKKLRENKKIDQATHNIIAYRITKGKDCGNVDDGEHGASAKMLHLMEMMGIENAMVIITRWYGGVHLGQDRFKHINNLTKEILQNNGFTREKTGKKGPRSGKK